MSRSGIPPRSKRSPWIVVSVLGCIAVCVLAVITGGGVYFLTNLRQSSDQPHGTTSRFKTPTPPPNPGTVIKDDGQFKILSHPRFYWTVRLPRDWEITYDRGFEVFANNPQRTAFMRIFSQLWGTDNEPLVTSRDYVNYWKNHKYGNIFPVYAQGTQVAEAEISQDKLGGPYLRYEFDDSKKGVHYMQVYASGGGPNSVVLTCWAKSADFDSVKTTLEGILDSLELLKQP